MKNLRLIPLFILCSTICSYAGESVSSEEVISCNVQYLKSSLQDKIQKQTKKIAKLQERLSTLDQNPDELDPEELNYSYDKLFKKIKSEQEKLGLMMTAYELAESKLPQ